MLENRHTDVQAITLESPGRVMAEASAGRVRPAHLSDVTELLRIEEAAFAVNRIKPRQMRYLVRRSSVLALVYEEAAQVLGYAACFVPQGRRVARLYSLAVSDVARGKGVGRHLVAACLQGASDLGFTELRLEVRALDARVRLFYEGLGFRVQRELSDYYDDHADAVRMGRLTSA